MSDLASGFAADTPLDTAALNALGSSNPNNILAWTTIPAVPLTSGGFQNVTVDLEANQGGQIVVAQGTTLAVQPGGSITLKAGGSVDVLGSLIAPAGTISISSDILSVASGITVASGALISVAGEWVNDGQFGDQTAGDSTFINAGHVTLSTTDANASGSDVTGSIILQNGSVIDLSSGGVLLPGGALLASNGIPEGKGGSLSLLTYDNPTVQFFGNTADGGPSLPNSQPTAGRIVMDGTIDSFGFAGGGTLTLQALGFQIGGDPSAAPSFDLYLPANFFASQGFGSYVLNAMYDVTVAPGTIVRLTQQNLIPNVAALAQAPTGADLNANNLTGLGTIDPFDRQATNLVITADGYLQWSGAATAHYSDVTNGLTVGAGASIIADAGASIGLGSPTQVTVLGSIIAPGGAITLSADSRRQPLRLRPAGAGRCQLHDRQQVGLAWRGRGPRRGGRRADRSVLDARTRASGAADDRQSARRRLGRALRRQRYSCRAGGRCHRCVRHSSDLRRSASRRGAFGQRQ